MAKVGANTIYRWEWTGKQSKWQFRLDFIASDDENLNEPNIAIQDNGSIISMDYERELEDYLVGMGSAGNIKIKFNLARISNLNLQSFMLYPFINHSFSITKGVDDGYLAGTSIPIDFDTANYIELCIKFVGNDDNEPVNYRPVFRGVQKAGIESGYDVEKQQIEIEFYSLRRVIFENFNFDLLAYMWRKNIWESDTSAIDWLYFQDDGGDKSYFVTGSFPIATQTGFNYTGYLWYCNHSSFQGYVNEILDIIGKKYVRTDEDFAISLPLPTFRYKQFYDNTPAATNYVGKIGAALSSASEVFYIGFLADKDHTERADATIIAGLFYDDLQASYKNLWDFYTDLLKENLVIGNDSYYFLTLTSYSKLFSDDGSIFQMQVNGNPLNSFISCKPSFRAEILQRAQSPLVKTVAKDLNMIEAINPSSRAEKTETFPVIFTNIPIVYDDDVKYQQNDSGTFLAANKFSITNNPYSRANFQRVTKKFHFKGQYYKQRAQDNSSNYITTREKFIRMHERCDYSLGSVEAQAYDTSDFVAFSPLDFRSMSYDAQPIGAQESLFAQTYHGKSNVIAYTMLGIFGKNYTSKIEGEAFINCLTRFSGGGDIGCLWFEMNNALIKFDLSNIAPKNNENLFNNYPLYWHLRKVEINFLSEKVKFEIIGFDFD